MVIVTGPTTEDDRQLLDEKVKVLRKRGVDVLIVAVGNVDVSMLQKITDDGTKERRVLLARDYSGIMQYTRDIPDFACGNEATTPEADSVSIFDYFHTIFHGLLIEHEAVLLLNKLIDSSLIYEFNSNPGQIFH